MPIPLKLALFDRESGRHSGEQLIVLDDARAEIRFGGFAQAPALSINRGFSAPVSIERETPKEELVFLAAHDDDPFARYEAMQQLTVAHLVAAVGGGLDDAARAEGRNAIREAFVSVLVDTGLDDLMRGELMLLPMQSYLAEQLLVADPGRIFEEREGLKAWLGAELADELGALYERVAAVPYSRELAARGARKVKSLVLTYFAAADPERAAGLASAQYDAADNMTDRQGALMTLAGLQGPQRTHELLDFYNRYRGDALVIDKWFIMQSGSLHPQVLDHVEALAQHPDFTLKNPNRVRALYMPFTATALGFHAPDGGGYRLIADLILALDPLNPQTAARFVTPLGRWRRIEPSRAALMRAELERIAAAASLSRDTREQVSRSLG